MSDDAPKKKIVLKQTRKKSKRRPLARLSKVPPKKAEPEAEPAGEEAAVEVPETRAPESAAAAPEPPAPVPPVEPDEQFEFFCPYCAQPNAVAVNRVGEAVSCAGCGSTLTIPPPLAAPPSKKKSQKIIFKFYCSICGQKLSATPRQVGATTVCPSCNSSITVPESQPAPPSSDDTAAGDQPAATDTFKFHCPNCAKRYEAKRSWSGRPFACPNCHTEVTVPDAPRG